MPQITLPTRAGRAPRRIDKVLINSFENKCTSSNITTSVSDHSESFQSDIKEIDWSLATENHDSDLGFKIFFNLFSTTLDKHAPYK